MSGLFSPLKIRNMTLKNRVVMPPIACFGHSSGAEGLATEKAARHYEARARGGTGLIIIEVTCVNQEGRLHLNELGLWSDDQIEGFSRIAEVCHRHGAGVLVQIHHTGMGVPIIVSPNPVAPSDSQGRSPFGEVRPARALTLSQIEDLEGDFVAAAVRAKKAGLDGVELHGAHGYLGSQFLSPQVNRRLDQYGGTAANRTRFFREILAGIRKANGEDFVVGCRLGGYEPDLKTGIENAVELDRAGIDYLHASSGYGVRLEVGPDNMQPTPPDFPFNWVVYGGTQIKQNVKAPVIVVNEIKTPAQADYLIHNGLADLAAIGRGLLCDPEWSNKARENRDVIECLGCKFCAVYKPESPCPQTGASLYI